MSYSELKKQLKDYASVVWQPDDIIELRFLPVGKERQKWVTASDIEGEAEWLSFVEKKRANIYAGVLPRTEKGGSKQEDVVQGSVVWADFDHMTPQEAWKQSKKSGMLEPTMVVATGHGAHLFWKLDKVQPAIKIVELAKNLAVMVDSDPSVADAARILRLPGFTNWKSEPWTHAEMKYCNLDNVYSLIDLKSAIKIKEPERPRVKSQAPADKSKYDRAISYVMKIPGDTKGGRTAAAYKVAACCLIDFTLSDGEAMQILRSWDDMKNNPPIGSDSTYKAGELERILAHAKRYGKKMPGSMDRNVIPKFEIKGPKAESNITDSMKKELSLQIEGKRNVIPLPWKILNNSTKALRPGSVIILAGPIKTGKSFFLNTIAMELEDQKIPWSYLPLEDTKQDFAWRCLAILENDYTMIDMDMEGAHKRGDKLEQNKKFIDKIMLSVSENPRVGHKDVNGDSIVPPIPSKSVTAWARRSLKKSKVIFIDPFSQIEFDARNRYEEEGEFIRELLAIASDTGGIIVLALHATKRSGVVQDVPLTDGDVQGSAMLTRLAHVTMIISGHDDIESEVLSRGGRETVLHNRTIFIAATRNGGGTRSKIAFSQGSMGPTFVEHGVIVPKKKVK